MGQPSLQSAKVVITHFERTWLLPVIASAVVGPLVVFCLGVACFLGGIRLPTSAPWPKAIGNLSEMPDD
jgi:hypothetical protein